MGKTHLHACARAIYNKVYLKKYQNILHFSCTIQKLYIPLHRQKQNDTHINKKTKTKAHPMKKTIKHTQMTRARPSTIIL